MQNAFETLQTNSKQFKSGIRTTEIVESFREAIDKTLDWYNEDTFTNDFTSIENNDLIYDPELREALEDLRDSLGQEREVLVHNDKGEVVGVRTIYDALSSETLELTRKALILTTRYINEVNKRNIDKVLPSVKSAQETLRNNKYGVNKNGVAKLWRKYKRGALPAYVVIREIFGGNSILAEKITTDMQHNVNDRKLYVGLKLDAIQKKAKELNVLKQLENEVTVNGHKITVDQAIGLYVALQVDANYQAIDNSGMKYYDENGNVKDFCKKGEASELKQSVNDMLTDSQKQFGDYLLSTMNGEIKQDYINWYKDIHGQFGGENEIGEIGSNTYWMLPRYNSDFTDVTKMVKSAVHVFGSWLR